MCGIAGSWSLRGAPSDGERLRAGLDSIRHRGPDDSGEFAWNDPSNMSRVDLGLVRLAILDLSPAGHQPMTLQGGRYTISYNGEITNYVEIRNDLSALGETFRSDGDTEVLLKAWARWGVGALDRLEGMFAFAILDTQERTLTLARDPYGIKPLLYTRTAERIAFCSEMSGLQEIGIPHPKLDWQAAVDYLEWGAYDHSERTFIEGAVQLVPGHYVVIDTTTGKFSEPVRYWWPPVATTFGGNYADATESVRDLFLDSVKRNLRSDVPLGIALSGGLDSTAITGAVRHLEPELPIQSFSYIAPGFERSEDKWISLASQALGTQSHTVAAEAGDLERDLDDLIMAQGEPFGGPSIYAQYRVFRLAREHGVIVTLDGQGGDELFAGYFGYPAQRMHSLIETGHWVAAAKFAAAERDLPDWYRAVMPFEALAQVFPLRLRHAVRRPLSSPLLDMAKLRERGVDTGYPAVGPEPVRGERLKTHLRSTLSGYGLPMLLRHADRNSMHFSIESRVPFLDRALNEFLLTLPEEWLVGPDGTTKRILRDAMRGLVPDAIINRRDKVGFETPENAWLQRLAAEPTDPDHPIGFLRRGATDSVTGGLSERHIRWGRKSHWRLINLRRWVTLGEIDAR